MKIFKLNEMLGGWFLGNFEPSVIRESNFEVAIKKYNSGDYEKKHFHKIAYEITVIVKGKVLMNNKEYSEGDIIFLKPGESSDFKVLEETLTCVVKSPSVENDKYLIHS